MPKKKQSSLEHRRALREIDKMKEAFPVDTQDNTPSKHNLQTLPMLNIVIKEVLKGTTPQNIKDELYRNGYDLGQNKVHYVMKKAKEEILKRAEKDLDINYAWVQANLLEMHSKSIDIDDDRMRLVVIKELCALWGLNRQRVEIQHTEITEEMIEQFEQALLR